MRLFPLTKDRAKPAVPFGGKYRLVDIPISNCINSNFLQIYLLTQFNSTSLHLHIANTYRFDHFSGGFVTLLAAKQTFGDEAWYQGTADAVRKNMTHFRVLKPDYYIILSGDQLYRMDLVHFLKEHIKKKADITVASTPVCRSDANELGILKADGETRIEAFLEKPGPHKDISEYKSVAPRDFGSSEGGAREYLASMGIYIFSSQTMETALRNNLTDFGKEIIPQSLDKFQVYTHVYEGYWEDIGTIKSFFEASLDLTFITPQFNLYDMEMPLYTHPRDLPPSKLNGCMMNNALAAEGSIMTDSTLKESLVGLRTIIANGAYLERVICMGADYYETEEGRAENRRLGRPDIGIGQMSMIKNAIIDTNVRIGQGCRIGLEKRHREDADCENYYIRDGIIVLPKGAVIPDGTVI